MNEIVTEILVSMTDTHNYLTATIGSDSGYAVAEPKSGEDFINKLEKLGYKIVKI